MYGNGVMTGMKKDIIQKALLLILRDLLQANIKLPGVVHGKQITIISFNVLSEDGHPLRIVLHSAVFGE
jgi:hypothetical protein